MYQSVWRAAVPEIGGRRKGIVMTESLEHLTDHIGRTETATDVVTASTMIRFAATLGLPDPPLEPGSPIPPGWYGGMFPPSHRPYQMRIDGQPSGGGLVPPIPLPRRRIGGTTIVFDDPLRIGDEVTRVGEIADIVVDDGPGGAMVTVVERSTLSTIRGRSVVEERQLLVLSEERASSLPLPAASAPAPAAWTQIVEPTTTLLFRFSALRFNSHRIHYDRDYVTQVEKLPGLVVQSSLIVQLLMEMCRRELPTRTLASFDFRLASSIYDTGGAITLAGTPSADGAEASLWALDGDGRLCMTATAAFTAAG